MLEQGFFDVAEQLARMLLLSVSGGYQGGAIMRLQNKRTSKAFLLTIAMACSQAMLCQPADAQGTTVVTTGGQPVSTMYKGEVVYRPLAVRVAGEEVFTMNAPAGGFTAQERALIVERNINNALISTVDRSPASVEIVPINNLPVIRIGGKHVVTIDSNSARMANTSMADLATLWSENMKKALSDSARVNTYVASLQGDFIPTVAAVPSHRPRWEAARLNHAADSFRSALPVGLQSSASFTDAGMTAYMNRDFVAAGENFKKALQLNNANAYAHYGLGISSLKLGQVNNAMSELQMSRWLEPDNALTHIALGQAYEAQGYDTAAIAQYREAALLQPDNPEPYLAIADLREERNDIGKSVAELGTAISIMPNSQYLRVRQKDQLTWRLIRPY
jgi:Flp pilus assembly protein TadD